MLSLLTRTKSFEDPWVGHPQWNQRWSLHRLLDASGWPFMAGTVPIPFCRSPGEAG